MKNHARHAVRLLLTTLLLAALAIAPAAPSLAAWIDHPTEVDGLPPTSGQPGALTPSEIDPDELKNSYRTSIPQALEPSAGELVVSLRAVLNYFDARSSGYDELQRLPLFKITADSCDHAASDLVVLHPLRGLRRTPGHSRPGLRHRGLPKEKRRQRRLRDRRHGPHGPVAGTSRPCRAFAQTVVE